MFTTISRGFLSKSRPWNPKLLLLLIIITQMIITVIIMSFPQVRTYQVRNWRQDRPGRSALQQSKYRFRFAESQVEGLKCHYPNTYDRTLSHSNLTIFSGIRDPRFEIRTHQMYFPEFSLSLSIYIYMYTYVYVYVYVCVYIYIYIRAHTIVIYIYIYIYIYYYHHYYHYYYIYIYIHIH